MYLTHIFTLPSFGLKIVEGSYAGTTFISIKAIWFSSWPWLMLYLF